MRARNDRRLFFALRAGAVGLVAVSAVGGLEFSASHVPSFGLLCGVLLLVGARVFRARNEAAATGWVPQALFWVDLSLALVAIGYLAQSSPSGAALALIFAGVAGGWCGVGLLREVVTRTVQRRAVVRLALFVTATAGTITYFLYATGVGWHPGWATQLLIITGISGVIGAGTRFVLLHATGQPPRPSTSERTH